MAENAMGRKIYELCRKIFPICRSITGDGVRETLRILDNYIFDGTSLHLDIHEIPTGTKVFDWTIPKEWRIREAYIEDELGNHIIDFKKNNLHVMGYSLPIDEWIDRDDLDEFIYTQPDQPDWIPYVTSYYKDRVGFCMSENLKKSLKSGRYHLCCDSEQFDGSLTYAELLIKGRSDKEILITTYICHPSMANNECSGPSLVAELIRFVSQIGDRKYSYRFVFEPETIGAIAYICQNLERLQKNVIGGFNISCAGDDRSYYMVESPNADTLSDRVIKNVLKFRGSFDTYSYLKRGSDERQYNSPGIEVPMVCFGRSKFGEYPEYHTSADDMNLVCPEGFQGSYEVMTETILALEHNEVYLTAVCGEPQLGKRGLYPTVSQKGNYDQVLAMVDLLGYADGRRDLIEISDKIGVPVKELIPIVIKLVDNQLLRSV